MIARLTDYKVLTFDCYGTLIDWEFGMWDAFQPPVMQDDNRYLRRNDVLAAFARREPAPESATQSMRYPDPPDHVHSTIAAEFGMTTTARLDGEFSRSVAHWPTFSDTAGALRDLKTRYKLAIDPRFHYTTRDNAVMRPYSSCHRQGRTDPAMNGRLPALSRSMPSNGRR